MEGALQDKPAGCVAARCPLAVTCSCNHQDFEHTSEGRCGLCACREFRSKGRGFALGTGDPRTAKIALVLEGLGKDEVEFSLRPLAGRRFFETQAECDREVELRRRDFPGLEERFIRNGAPVVGKTGMMLEMWLFGALGVHNRSTIYIDNTLRCLPPENKAGEHYPIGEERKGAEAACRQWDRFGVMKPDLVTISLHPASLMREVSPLPLVVKDFERARDYVQQGFKVMLCLGGKAAGYFMGFGSSVLKMRGAYRWVRKGEFAPTPTATSGPPSSPKP